MKYATETTHIPGLRLGDKIHINGCLAEVVAKRDYPARVHGATEGADGPCSQVDLKLIEAETDLARSDFKFLARGNADGLALIQGNHLYPIARVTGPAKKPVITQEQAQKLWEEGNNAGEGFDIEGWPLGMTDIQPILRAETDQEVDVYERFGTFYIVADANGPWVVMVSDTKGYWE